MKWHRERTIGLVREKFTIYRRSTVTCDANLFSFQKSMPRGVFTGFETKSNTRVPFRNIVHRVIYFFFAGITTRTHKIENNRKPQEKWFSTGDDRRTCRTEFKLSLIRLNTIKIHRPFGYFVHFSPTNPVHMFKLLHRSNFMIIPRRIIATAVYYLL